MGQSIVFFGSGPVAAQSLALIAEKFTIEAIITKSSTVAMMQSVQIAPSASTAVYTADSRLELDNLILRQHFDSALGVLVDFGIIVSQKVIDYFPLGIINSHFSLLPEWRGADPISFAILSGQKKTGVSLMLISDKMDEGQLLVQSEVTIDRKETEPSLTTKLISLSNELLQDSLPKYINGQLKPYIQKQKNCSYSRKLTKQDGLLDFTKPASRLEREIRAFINWPKSRAWLGSIEVIIVDAQVISEPTDYPGRLEYAQKNPKQLLIHCGQDKLNIKTLKPAGKANMTAEDFLRGYSQKIGKTGQIINQNYR